MEAVRSYASFVYGRMNSRDQVIRMLVSYEALDFSAKFPEILIRKLQIILQAGALVLQPGVELAHTFDFQLLQLSPNRGWDIDL